MANSTRGDMRICAEESHVVLICFHRPILCLAEVLTKCRLCFQYWNLMPFCKKVSLNIVIHLMYLWWMRSESLALSVITFSCCMWSLPRWAPSKYPRLELRVQVLSNHGYIMSKLLFETFTAISNLLIEFQSLVDDVHVFMLAAIISTLLDFCCFCIVTGDCSLLMIRWGTSCL